ncbi:hypothetical protein FRB94_004058 [Tulasnella sp. JGI-2019a]|nr:hypothetical protein FRB94_004058 [Tulasnella sp. JGI-2019a]KAG9010370.1 hypothetical protein FRB93_004209 [Tulasnella sp. JGI-2019a]KAG9038662.1 hypothetical protein FRB95_000251 [Tulasnella sp. JGI-2019a]
MNDEMGKLWLIASSVARSPAVFDKLADPSVGVFQMSWEFMDGDKDSLPTVGSTKHVEKKEPQGHSKSSAKKTKSKHKQKQKPRPKPSPKPKCHGRCPKSKSAPLNLTGYRAQKIRCR